MDRENRADIAIIGTGPAGLSAAINAKIRKKKFSAVWQSGFKPQGGNFAAAG